MLLGASMFFEGWVILVTANTLASLSASAKKFCARCSKRNLLEKSNGEMYQDF